MRSSLLLSIALASLALASPLPDIEPVEFTPRPTKTMTCDCSKVTDCAEKRPAKRSEASKACLTRDVVDSVIADVTYFLTQAAVDPAGVNSTADRIFTENLEIWSGGMKFLADVPVSIQSPLGVCSARLILDMINSWEIMSQRSLRALASWIWNTSHRTVRLSARLMSSSPAARSLGDGFVNTLTRSCCLLVALRLSR